MNLRWFLFFFLIPRLVWAGACCIGGGPRSFVQLRQFQSYDLGIATSFKDNFARLNSYGEAVETEKLQTYTVALGASAKVLPRTEAYTILPVVLKNRNLGPESRSRANLGDVLVGGRFSLYDPLYMEDWFPETKILFSVKAPSGTTDEVGTGNGIWEPSLGVQFQKDFSNLIAAMSVSFTHRFPRSVKSPVSTSYLSVKEGDRIEVSETVTVPLTQDWSVALGSSQVWDLGGSVNNKGTEDSHGRYISGLLSATYFIDRFWRVSAAFEGVLPFSKWGANEDAYRTVTLTSTYAIY